MDTQTTQAAFCSECGNRLSPGARFCTNCGKMLGTPEDAPQEASTLPLKPPAPGSSAEPSAQAQDNVPEKAVKKKAGGGVLRGLLTALLTVLLTCFSALFLLAGFAHTLAPGLLLPSAGPVDGRRLAETAGSLYPVILSGILAALPALLILCLNVRRLRRAFLSVGLSAILLSLLCFLGGLLVPAALPRLTAQWQDALWEAALLFRDLASAFSVFFLLLGALLLSAYFCIRALRRDKR